MTTLNGASLRDWDPADAKAAYWTGAEDALERALLLPGCDADAVHDALVEALDEARANRKVLPAADVEREEGWYTLGAAEALDDVIWALPDSVVDDDCAFEGLDRLQHAKDRWARRNSGVGDAFAGEVGLL